MAAGAAVRQGHQVTVLEHTEKPGQKILVTGKGDVYKRQDHTDRGLRVKTRRGRGNTAVIDGLVFRNVEMRGVKAPFVINMFYFCLLYTSHRLSLPLSDSGQNRIFSI